MVALVDINNPKERRPVLELKKEQQRNRIPTSQGSARAPIPQVASDNVVKYLNTALATYVTSLGIRNQMLQRDLSYYRESDFTAAQQRARAYNQAGDTSKIQNVTIPIVMPQVESALAYHTSVFLTGYPIFGTVAPPEHGDSIGQMDTIVGENSIRAGWIPQLMQTIRDGLKYDLGACEVTWEKKKTFNIGTPEIKQLTTGSVDETIYQGNFIKRLDPYNLILDTRVSPEKNHIEGELAGYTEIVSAVAMKQRIDELDPLQTMNLRDAFESPSTGSEAGGSTAGYYTPSINPGALLPTAVGANDKWTAYFGDVNNQRAKDAIKYQASYEWTVLYLRLIPSMFGIYTKGANHVQIWKFIVVNRSVCIFAEKQTNAHNYLPILVCKPTNDGLGWQSKSFAENAEPFQFVASALTNSAIESQRRKVYDRMFYDPARIAKGDIDKVSSVARIPVKNSQYNKDISSAVYIAPYRDEGVSDILAFAQNVTQMADIANGQNRVTQGQFQKGNKTRHEFDTVMNNANSRPQMQALTLEYTFFAPLKEIIKSNILQYQPPATLTNSNTNETVAVDPQKLREAMLSFKMSDGLLPTSKMVSGDVFGILLQTAQAVPEIRAEYDIMGVVGYQLQLQGADWLASFKRTEDQKAQYLQMMQQSALAAGNAKPEQQPAAQAATAAA